jgi:hypothetical protein
MFAAGAFLSTHYPPDDQSAASNLPCVNRKIMLKHKI